ncbi:T-cell differentiation antigen CD6 isoform X2 [Ornithorhynchus anatinus]|uniref:T-cell differentiation antigen CD6 n=1 Tax=Ornithorhynchus anatinus TaxID=9258 RepID=F6SAL4_ORNAN|nr:T-cell differentiation antigen CD6 isoform X2 [Ornithorhynchus anatinus]
MRLLFLAAGFLVVAVTGQISNSTLLPLLLSDGDGGDGGGEKNNGSSSEPGRQPLRLVNGMNSCSGTVEIQYLSSWQAVCEEHWDSRAAEVACLRLGCGRARAVGLPATSTPKGPAGIPVTSMPSGPAGLPVTPNARVTTPAGNGSAALEGPKDSFLSVQCTRDRWESCQVQPKACLSQKAAWLVCQASSALRLADGGSRCEGRVELEEQGSWGTVCDDAWDLDDAGVVCGQLGCGWAIQALQGSHFPKGKGPIYLDEVNCSGTETSLGDCPAQKDHDCGHKEDAGVICSEHQAWRLTKWSDACAGQVEVHFRGTWSTVCDGSWYQTEGAVLCRSLGCGALTQVMKGLPHHLTSRINYQCSGEEATLSQCTWHFNRSHICHQSQAAGVICAGAVNRSTVPEINLSTQPTFTDLPENQTLASVSLREQILFVTCISLGVLLFGLLTVLALILMRIKGKYVPHLENHNQQASSATTLSPIPTTTTSAGANNYQEVSIVVPKEEAPKLPIQVPGPPSEDSDSDYEQYDFSTQPPVALSTFYNSQRHRVTEDEVRESKFRMPPLEEDPPKEAPLHHPRNDSESSTSSGEEYCNSPSSRLPQRSGPAFPAEKAPFLGRLPIEELAGSQQPLGGLPTVSKPDSSSSTSSGEWYQNFDPPQPLEPPPPPPQAQEGEEESCLCSEPSGPVATGSSWDCSTDDDYDDIATDEN